ncbi:MULTISPECIES: hypothetical protein [Uliginosibacterium]|uniref:Uncharacterized protein n=1 Tax=Uliginosibacterium aquaticum TaxID=2731212 RepID=A0ABX2IHU5_9RHOO|nr:MULTISPECIES: hypothetical protein [Uliginosibacterium]MDO6384835.1 hypothetical protein [Uliginosibacterium sp. 31-12]NSL55453.1 hypothetical protein [Uliginosibacterium aquaticum]PLK48519.1 hypothetical protein C0V76_10645 [Uliginosibacterium sp. TH139]
MKSFFRTLFGIRTKRRALPVTPAPQVGAYITRNGYKIKVTQPCSVELWDWLLLAGWRVIPVRNDRRASVRLPDEAMPLLGAASIEQRQRVLDGFMASVRSSRQGRSASRPTRH